MTNNDFMTMATQFYDNIQCSSVIEFNEDMKRFNHVKKHFKRCDSGKDFKTRLIVNHLITIMNLWGIASFEMLFFKTEKEHWGLLASVLEGMGVMPDELPSLGVKKSELTMNCEIMDQVRSL